MTPHPVRADYQGQRDLGSSRRTLHARRGLDRSNARLDRSRSLSSLPATSSDNLAVFPFRLWLCLCRARGLPSLLHIDQPYPGWMSNAAAIATASAALTPTKYRSLCLFLFTSRSLSSCAATQRACARVSGHGGISVECMYPISSVA